MKIITIPNLNEYQHYKNRDKMPWIKWHKKCLRDYKFCQLKNGERWIFIGLVMLAMENKNKIPADFHYIAKTICYFPVKTVREEGENGARMVRKSFSPMRELTHAMMKLLDLNLIAISRIAKCYQDDKRDRDEDVDEEEEKKPLSFNKTKKRYYKNEEMRFSQGKWWVLPKNGGKWLEFGGKLEETEMK